MKNSSAKTKLRNTYGLKKQTVRRNDVIISKVHTNLLRIYISSLLTLSRLLNT